MTESYTFALNYAMTWPQNPSEELHYTNTDTQCLYIVHGCYPRLSACTFIELVEPSAFKHMKCWRG